MKQQKKTGSKRIWWIAAVCAAVVLLAAALVLGLRVTSVGGVTRIYRNVSVSVAESAMEWPYEYQLLTEQFGMVVYDGREYVIRTDKLRLDSSQMGEVLGVCEGIGYETTFDPETKTWNDFEYRRTFEARQIHGVSEDWLIAVNLDGSYYVYRYQEYDPPADLGEFLDLYSLPQTLELSRYTVHEEGRETGTYRMEDDTYIWEVLDTCRDAGSWGQNGWEAAGKNYISFTVTSEALGVYKHVLYISEDGYLKTNAMDWGYSFKIGEEAANKIISYAREHGVKAKSEPYTYSLRGTVTELGEDYLVVDDSVLCAMPGMGKAFKVLTEDPRIRRWVESGRVEVGDIVVVDFVGQIEVGEENTVAGAYDLRIGYLSDGTISIPE